MVSTRAFAPSLPIDDVQHRSAVTTSMNPAVSVIVPCRNEREHIERCVRSIQAQEQPTGGLEIIVADGMSDDGTRPILERLASEDPRLRVIDNPGRIAACGR